jgi:HK97 gp10 family phage protein
MKTKHVTLTTKIPRLRKELRKRAGEIVRKAALDIEAHAKTLAPVDTGALRNSIRMEPTGELSAEVAVGVDYGLYVEMGTVHAPAQPFLTPAVEHARPAFEGALKQLVKV